MSGRNRLFTSVSTARTSKGWYRKKMRSGLAVSRTDEDSGYGGDSLDDPELEDQKKEIPTADLSHTLGFQNFGLQSKERSSENEGESKQKRLRLDLPEEANELPEEKHVEASQIVSFRNVPDIRPVVSSNNVTAVQKSLPGKNLHLHKSLISKPQVVIPLVDKASNAAVKGTKRKSKVDASNIGLMVGNFPSKSSDGTVELLLLSQPEEQHRARYQTEGSRGAVKDLSGKGHPVVKLSGSCKSTILQVFVASDGGAVGPHMFYQACKVSSRNSTPCTEERIDGTVILKIALSPQKEMTVNCDCVGILKERNVDVEKRSRAVVGFGRKRSQKCRLAFRTTVVQGDGHPETLQVISQPISCTQPPGIPEICRTSSSKCSVEGGEELFIIGKNFTKDTEVLFQEEVSQEDASLWSHKVIPDKEFLHATHLICKVPPYPREVDEDAEILVSVLSGGRQSDAQPFRYVPLSSKRRTRRDQMQLYVLHKEVPPGPLELNGLYADAGDQLMEGSRESNPDPASAVDVVEGVNFVKMEKKKLAESTGKKSVGPFRLPQGNTNLLLQQPSLHFMPIRKPVTLSNDSTSVISSEQNDPGKISREKLLENIDNKSLRNLLHMLKLIKTLPTSVPTSCSSQLISREIDNASYKAPCSLYPIVGNNQNENRRELVGREIDAIAGESYVVSQSQPPVLASGDSEDFIPTVNASLQNADRIEGFLSEVLLSSENLTRLSSPCFHVQGLGLSEDSSSNKAKSVSASEKGVLISPFSSGKDIKLNSLFATSTADNLPVLPITVDHESPEIPIHINNNFHSEVDFIQPSAGSNSVQAVNCNEPCQVLGLNSTIMIQPRDLKVHHEDFPYISNTVPLKDRGNISEEFTNPIRPLAEEETQHRFNPICCSISTSFDPSSGIRIESSDPLLSQANAAQPLVPLSMCSQPTGIITSSNLNTIGALSENELLSYINPTYFDNV